MTLQRAALRRHWSGPRGSLTTGIPDVRITPATD